MTKAILYRAPLNNSVLYCRKPRILFNINNEKNSIIYIKLKNSQGIFNYTSSKNPELFSAVSFNNNENIVFIPEDTVEGENYLYIRVLCEDEFSREYKTCYIYKKPLLNEMDNTIKITADIYKKIMQMTLETLKAYNWDTDKVDNIVSPVADKIKIYKSYFSRINDSLYDLNTWINENYPGLNRYYDKELIAFSPIKLKIYNSIIKLITCL